jgi:hypothetical protein
MISRRGQVRRRLGALALALALCGAVAATAVAFVNVYVNPFSKRGQYRQVDTASKSKRCDRDFNKDRGVMEVTVKAGPQSCFYEIPARGDRARPDHRFEAHGRLLKSTHRNIREEAFLAVAVRVGGGDRYELRVFPKGKDFALRRRPDSGAFPVSGSEPAIGRPGQLNRLRLTAIDNRLTAHVNGEKVADLNDADASQIAGRKVEFGLGSRADTRRNTNGNFDRVKLSVPDP